MDGSKKKGNLTDRNKTSLLFETPDINFAIRPSSKEFLPIHHINFNRISKSDL